MTDRGAPAPRRLRRSRLLAAVPVLCLLAACGDADGAAAPTATDAPSVSGPAADPAAADAAGIPADWAPLLDDLRCEDTAVGDFPRTVQHAQGETVVEAEPLRVLSVEGTTSLDLLLLMGVTPAAAGADVDNTAVYPWQAYLAGGTPEDPGFELVQKRPEVSVEQIAAARPDLVISQTGWLEDIQDQVEALGVPVVTFEWGDSGEPPDWRDNVRIVAEAVGRDGCVDDIVSTVEAAAADTRASLEASGAADDTWGAFVAIEGYTAYYGADDPIGQTLAGELGLDLQPSDGAQTEFSLENASGVLVADRLVATDFYGDGVTQDFLEEPVVAPVADRVDVLDADLSGAAYYPSAVGLRLFLDHLEETHGD